MGGPAAGCGRWVGHGQASQARVGATSAGWDRPAGRRARALGRGAPLSSGGALREEAPRDRQGRGQRQLRRLRRQPPQQTRLAGTTAVCPCRGRWVPAWHARHQPIQVARGGGADVVGRAAFRSAGGADGEPRAPRRFRFSVRVRRWIFHRRRQQCTARSRHRRGSEQSHVGGSPKAPMRCHVSIGPPEGDRQRTLCSVR